MKTLNIKLLLVVCSLFIFNSIYAQTPKVVSFLTIDTIKVGEQISLDFIYSFANEYQLVENKWNDTISKDIEIISNTGLDKESYSEDNNYYRSIIITCFDSGNYYIPKYEFLFVNADGDSVLSTTDSIVLTVLTVLTDTSQEPNPLIEPIILLEEDSAKNSVNSSFWKTFLIILLSFLLLSAIILFFVIRYIRKMNRKSMSLEDKLSAEEFALIELENLRKEQLWQQGFIKKYHSKLTDILRKYIDKQLGVRAIEMTSSQILEEIEKIDVSPEIYKELKYILINADLVKFAKAKPLAPENDLSHQYAIHFINDTTPIKEEEEKKGEENADN